MGIAISMASLCSSLWTRGEHRLEGKKMERLDSLHQSLLFFLLNPGRECDAKIEAKDVAETADEGKERDRESHRAS
jgi:hypothetical protein